MLHFDYALIKLKKRVEFDEVMEISVPCKECLNEQEQSLYISGFPSHKDNFTHSKKKGDGIKPVQCGLGRKNRIQHYSES
jgi:hypothetical protein